MEDQYNTILIIEDDSGLIELIGEKIIESGYQYKSFGRASEAISWLSENIPLLIILDYSLPDLNGLEFIATLKNRGIELPPFVVATGRGDERIAVELMKKGSRDYIVKDNNFLDMISVVIDRTIKDISNEIKLKQTREELEELSRFNNQIIECAHEGIVVYDKKLHYVLWNKFMEETTGYRSEEVIGKHALEVFPFLERNGIYENINKALRDEAGTETEFFFSFESKQKSGWLSNFTTPLRNTKNEIIGAISAVHNITDRKNAEAEVLKIAKHYQTIIEKAPDGFVLLDELGQFKYVSPSARRIFGYDIADEISVDPGTLTHPDDLPTVINVLNQIMENPSITPKIQYRFANKQNGWVWIESIFSNLLSNPNVESIVINFRDITEQKESEIALLESEKKFRSITEQTDDFIGITDENGIIIYASSASLSMFGYSPDEMTGTNFMKYVEIEEKENAQHTFISMFSHRQNAKNTEFNLIKKNGSVFCGEVSGSKYSQGGINGVMVVIHDMTQRKKAENNLIRSKSALQKLVEFSTELIESNTDNIDFGKITDTIHEISGSSYAFFNLFQPNTPDFKTVGMSGLTILPETLRDFIGFDVMKKKWKHDPNKAERIKDKTITKFASLTDLAHMVIEPKVCSLIEENYNLGEVYIVKTSKNNISKGDFTLIYKKGEAIQNLEIIELYANQVGLYIERQQADVLLKESERKYRVLFADNPQPMLIYDLSTLKILEVNKTAQSHYGYSRKEFLSMDITNLHSKEDLDSILEKIERTRHGEKTDGISKHVKKNGDHIFVEINTMPTPSFGENARHIIINDITLRKIAEDNLKTSFSLLNATLESTADGILVVDKEGIATIYNQKFVQMWNIPKEILDEKLDEQLLRYIFTLIDNPQDFLDKVSYLHQNPKLSSIDLIKLVDGRTFERFSLPQWVGSEINGRVWSFRDISDRLKAEEEIQQKITEMTRFHRLTVGRELTMIELKKEINELYKKSGHQEKYKIID